MKDITAIIIAIAGVILCYACFIVLHYIHDSVLWYFAQSLTFTAAVFGVTYFIKNKDEDNK